MHNARLSAFVIKACEVKEAIEKLKLHKSDGGFMLSSDHFLKDAVKWKNGLRKIMFEIK